MMKRKNIHRNERGFTLLEVMIALAVLAGVLVTVLATVNHHLAVATTDMDIITATLAGRARVEEAALFGIPGGAREGKTGRFRWSESTADTGIKDLVRIEITVKWDEKREVRFISYRRMP